MAIAWYIANTPKDKGTAYTKQEQQEQISTRIKKCMKYNREQYKIQNTIKLAQEGGRYGVFVRIVTVIEQKETRLNKNIALK